MPGSEGKSVSRRIFISTLLSGAVGSVLGGLVGRASAQTNTPIIATDGITLASLSNNPQLEKGKVFFRGDLEKIYYSPDGTIAKRLLAEGDVSNSVLDHQHSSAAGDGGNVLAQHYVYAPDKSQLLLVRNSGLTQGGSILVYGEAGVLGLIANGVFDGSAYNRLNTSYPIWLIEPSPSSDQVKIRRAAAGSNPASLSDVLTIRNDGRIVAPDVGALLSSADYVTIQYSYGDYELYYQLIDTVGLDAIRIARSGEIYNFRVKVYSNTINSSVTVRTSINGAASNPSVTIPASTTGTFTSTGTQSVNAGDRFAWWITTTGATSGSMQLDQGGICACLR